MRSIRIEFHGSGDVILRQGGEPSDGIGDHLTVHGRAGEPSPVYRADLAPRELRVARGPTVRTARAARCSPTGG